MVPFPLRYAVYLYYRSRGWIVQPALTLGGADYLLYAESPSRRHAAYAVIVAPASAPPLVRDVIAHLRVVSSVAKVLMYLNKNTSCFVLLSFSEVNYSRSQRAGG